MEALAAASARRHGLLWELRILPDEDEPAKIIRHAAHLERVPSKAPHELQRRQAKRLGGAGPGPLVVDVTSGSGPFLDA